GHQLQHGLSPGPDRGCDATQEALAVPYGRAGGLGERPMDTPDLDCLTLLERAQLLHDATLRRHGELLDAHADHLAAHAVAMAEMRQIQERQEHLLETLTGIAAQHQERMDRLQQTLDAIKDML